MSIVRTQLVVALIASLVAVATAACEKKEAEPPTQVAGEAASAEGEEAEEAPEGAEAPAASAEQEASAEPEEVVLWHAYRAREKAALEQVVAAFNEARDDVRIRLQAVPYDPFVDKISITVPRGQGPDVFIFAHNMIGPWVDKGLLAPLGTRVPQGALEAFLPQTVKALVYRKNLYGLPLAFKSLALFYNRALLDEAPETMEDLLTEVKGTQDPDAGTWGFVYEAGLLYNHAPWMHAFGGRVFGEDGQPALDTPAQVEALEFARSLHREHRVLPKGINAFMVTSLFNEGKAVACLNGPWFRAEIDEGVEYGVAPIPSVEGSPAAPYLGIESVFVSAKSEQKDAAVQVALYLAGEEAAKVRMEEGQQPVAHAATVRAGAEEDSALATFVEQAEDAVVMPARPEMQLVWSTMDMAVRGAVFGDKDPAEALEKAQAKVVEDIGKRGK
ncbi:MAG: extracellular solute-binding protein [Myxococcota bacterium]